MNLQNTLEHLGLTKKEAAVYLAALELGQSSVLQIAKKAEIKRPTVYITLDSLQEKGFMEAMPKGATTRYLAQDPKKIIERFDEKLNVFKGILPELRSIANAAPGKPKVRFYEGKKNILALYENEIFKAKDIIGVTSMQDVVSIFSKEEELRLLRLMKTNSVFIRDILDDSPEAHEYEKEKKRLAIGETKFLPNDLLFEIDFLVYNKKLAMISLKSLIAVVIEDTAISHAQRQLLEILWKSLKG